MKRISKVYRAWEDRPFLEIRRDRISVEYTDNSLSDPFMCETVVRPKGVDAVTVAIYRQGNDGIDILLRRCFRPAIMVVRPQLLTPIPEIPRDPWVLETVAGVVERGDRELAGIMHRAAVETVEESGYPAKAAEMIFLGMGGFPSPGMSPERIWYMALDVTGRSAQPDPGGDGSVLEVGGSTCWMGLKDALEASCIDGRIEDMKTEVVLRRLQEHLQER